MDTEMFRIIVYWWIRYSYTDFSFDDTTSFKRIVQSISYNFLENDIIS